MPPERGRSSIAPTSLSPTRSSPGGLPSTPSHPPEQRQRGSDRRDHRGGIPTRRRAQESRTEGSEATAMGTGLLERYNIGYDSSRRLLVCRTCRQAIIVREGVPYLRHFNKHYKDALELAEIRATVRALDLEDTLTIQRCLELQQPVAALRDLEILEVYGCTLCTAGLSLNLKEMKRHLSGAHGRISGRQREGIERCSVQILGRHCQGLRYFRIRVPTPDELEAARVRSRDLDGNDVCCSTEGLEHFRQRQAEMKREMELARAREMESMESSRVTRGERIPWLEHLAFREHLEGLPRQDIFKSYRQPFEREEGAAVMLALGLRSEELLGVTLQSCRPGKGCRLTRPMANMLCKFGQETRSGEGSYKGFRVALEAATHRRYFAHWSGLLCFFYRTARLDLLRRPGQEALHKATRVQLAYLDQFEEALESGDRQQQTDMVHALSKTFVQQVLTGDLFQAVLLSYCACLAVDEKGGAWREPGNLNSFLSGLIYCVQLVLLREAWDLESEGTAVDGLLKDLCERWLHPEKSTSVGQLLNWRLYLGKVSRTEVSTRQATWDASQTTLTYQGVCVSMEDITRLHHKTYTRARTILDRDLLLGLKGLPRLRPCDLKDSIHILTIDWHFGMHEDNAAVLHGREDCILEHICSTRDLKELYVEANGWRPSSARVYENHVQEFLGCLLVLAQLNPPLRGPEILSVTWKNTARLRSVLLHSNQVLLMTSYHKSQSMTGSPRTNVRYILPGAVGSLLLQYIAFVLPFRSQLEYAQYGRLASPYLWSRAGRPWPDTEVSKVLKEACHLSLVQPLGEANWRQMTAAIIKTKFDLGTFDTLFVGSHEAGEETEGTSHAVAETLVTLSNHSLGTHNRSYANAGTAGLHGANIWDGMLRRSYEACSSWSSFFRFGEVEVEAKLGREKRMGELLESDRPAKHSLEMTMPERQYDGDLLLLEARRVYGDPLLRWRSTEQAAAAAAIVSGQLEVLVVLPTGAGKSLLFQLPCCLPGARTTVVVVPLVALKLDLLLRSRQLGIECEEWRSGSRSTARLVIMSVESAASEEGRTYLYLLHNNSRLSRIVVDECHLILTAGSYRKAFDGLQMLRMIEGIQFVYLSASLPQEMQLQLMQAHRLLHLMVIRASTDRPMLRYRVLRLHTGISSLHSGASAAIKHAWSAAMPSARDRAMVFVRSRQVADQMALLLGCGSYHSGVVDKAHVINSWKAGFQGSIIVGTSGLGTGLDYAHVRLVVHVEQPHSLVDFAQESGRAGRDGKPACSMVILLASQAGQGSDSNSSSMAEYLQTKECLRQVLCRYMDGDKGLPCSAAQLTCQVCKEGPTADTVLVSAPSTAVIISCGRKPEASMAPQSIYMAGVKGDQMRLIRYRAGLMALVGQCVICYILGRQGWRQHGFNSCTSTDRSRMLAAKKALSGKWIQKSYCVCFKCYQPQAICDRTSCEFPDLVLQSVYARYVTQPNILRQLACKPLETLGAAFTWAGQAARLGAIGCITGNLVLLSVIETLEL